MSANKHTGPILYRPRFQDHVEWMTHWLVSRSRLRLRRIEARYE